jgi:hypothetical protein
MGTTGTLLCIERGQVSAEEMAALVAVLLARPRPPREEPPACRPRWSRRSEANAPAGSWLRLGSTRATAFGRVA